MPELPEVHTTATGLRKMIVGKTVKNVWSDFHLNTAHGHRKNIKNKRYFDGFKKIVQGKKIKGVRRIGKNVIIDLSNKHSIIVHMKMTGHLMYSGYNKKDPFNGYVHLRIYFTDGKEVVLSDMRKFASICIAETENLKNHEGIKDLGVDALEINKEDFKSKLSSKKTWPIKSALMDQATIAGIGNIYSDEILWQTGVHPLSPSSKVPGKKMLQIFKTMKKILKFSISKGGDSKSDYRNALGEKGGFQNFHKAYGRKGEKCLKRGCRGIIERTVIKGRSAHFCAKHQQIYK